MSNSAPNSPSTTATATAAAAPLTYTFTTPHGTTQQVLVSPNIIIHPSTTTVGDTTNTTCKGCGHPAVANVLWTFMRSSRGVMRCMAQGEEGCAVCGVLVRGVEGLLAEVAEMAEEVMGGRKGDGEEEEEEEELFFSVDRTQSGARSLLVRVLGAGLAASFYLKEDSPLLSSSLSGWPVGYDISGDTNSEESFGWFMKQLGHCDEAHEICRANSNSPLPKRVLDIGNSNNQRVKLYQSQGETERYACLSHCWGTYALVQTLTTNIESYKTNIPWDDLPLTYQHAIQFARKLNIRYLWIDSLCIIQDNEDDWRQEAAKMASTYQGSYLTISAAKSTGADGGLFSIAPAKLKKSLRIPFGTTPNQTQDVYVRLPLTHLEHRPGYGTVLSDKLPVFTRGWILQERLLSPRVLHFGPEELTWECQEVSACECSGITDKKSTRPYFTTQPKLYHGFARWKHLDDEELTTRWHDLVQDYTRLELSHEQDIFPAISGLAKEFARVKKSPYYAGLWGSSLLLDMLWISKISSTKVWPRRSKLYRAPTWSWASIKGNISYTETRVLTEPCKVLSVCCSAAGPDPTGEISDAYIVLRGPMMISKMRYKKRDAELSPHGVYELELLTTPKRMGNIYADYDPLHGEGKDSDAVMTAYCFRIGREISRGSSQFLLLRSVGEDVHTKLRVYERIGQVEIFTDFGIEGEEVDITII